MVTDPVADMLARIRNAALARHEATSVPASKIKKAIALILKREGYLADVQDEESDSPQRKLRLVLKYRTTRQAAFDGMRRVSRPGRRVYVGHDDIPHTMSGLGVAILSTSHGLMTDKEARKRKVGGEILCEVW